MFEEDVRPDHNGEWVKVNNLNDIITHTLKQAAEEVRKITETPGYINLTTEWGQLDEDGIAIAVSRQALEETIQALTDAQKLLTGEATPNQ